MSLSSLQLDAFIEVARAGSFSQAALNLNVTQSALSQRILNLEDELGSTLFIRATNGLRLTDLGQRLLRYCQKKEGLETEFFGEIKQETKELTGIVRVGGFSTVTRSVIVPSLAKLIEKNPSLKIEITTKELDELPQLLEWGQVDFIFFNQKIEKQGFISHFLGEEENVLVQSKNTQQRKNMFLDHDLRDATTTNFFKMQSKPPSQIQRSYCDEIYTIIDGVLNGFGKAIVPLHIAKKTPGLQIVKGLKPLKTSVYLVYFEQAYYTKLQTQLIKVLTEYPPRYLSV